MSSTTTGKITIVESASNAMTTATFESRTDLIITLATSGGTFGDSVGYATEEHLNGIDNLIEEMQGIRDNIAEKAEEQE